jgi:hypothetical protein
MDFYFCRVWCCADEKSVKWQQFGGCLDTVSCETMRSPLAAGLIGKTRPNFCKKGISEIQYGLTTITNFIITPSALLSINPQRVRMVHWHGIRF